MPKIHLTQQFADNPPILKNKPKMDYFDTLIPGFLLEVRNTGKGTYYQRYRDKHNRTRQSRIGPTDAITLEEAMIAPGQAAKKDLWQCQKVVKEGNTLILSDSVILLIPKGLSCFMTNK